LHLLAVSHCGLTVGDGNRRGGDAAVRPDIALTGDVDGGAAGGEQFDDAAGVLVAVGDRPAPRP
jgi:hypothetical protein